MTDFKNPINFKSSKITWKRLPKDGSSYENYWEFYIKGEHRGDIFKGKRCWHLIVFGLPNMRGSNVDELLLHLTGILVDKGN